MRWIDLRAAWEARDQHYADNHRWHMDAFTEECVKRYRLGEAQRVELEHRAEAGEIAEQWRAPAPQRGRGR